MYVVIYVADTPITHTCTVHPLPLLTDGVVSGAASVVLTEDVEECCDNDTVVGAVVVVADVSCAAGGASGSRTLMQSMRE